ncbi:prolipoprotein diacylglyceryl transferase [Kaustia mangrovi]|uniref:Phosphatidylglycerol--prolipoprotein diacylglyceryl transferase n=1 Tax=Kaustia mangrovi TaxID=2593653 RepID=A0A7S8HD34_9HYPH|nr:prolipoprotein diacylglyceryl transferase [Kaustia mangrovi]QPC44281.1 prolipoprotein diacylglyceryl transferase [Kaustia mangrovi]
MITFVLPFPAIDPVAVEVGPLAVRWYALAYIAGLLFAWWYIRRLVANEALWQGPPPLKPVDADDLIVWSALGVILGGRLGYVLFYNPAYFAANPLEIVQVWHGGMSFHGGFLGVVLAGILFARRHGISPFTVLDLAGASVPIGLFFGRIANFINGELYGRVSDVPWAMVFPFGGPEPRHPSQLYEALLEGVVLFVLLRWLTHGRGMLSAPGFVGGAFTAGYGLARIAVEFFRMPDAQIGYLAGWLTMGMLLSLPMVAAGLAIMWWATRKAHAA